VFFLPNRAIIADMEDIFTYQFMDNLHLHNSILS